MIEQAMMSRLEVFVINKQLANRFLIGVTRVLKGLPIAE